MRTDRYGNTSGQKCQAKGSGKEAKVQESVYTERERERERRAWNVKCMIIPVITGATGLVTKGLKKDLEAVPVDRSIDSPQKTAVLGTAHIIWKVLQCGTGRVSGGGIGIGSRGEVQGRKGLRQET